MFFVVKVTFLLFLFFDFLLFLFSDCSRLGGHLDQGETSIGITQTGIAKTSIAQTSIAITGIAQTGIAHGGVGHTGGVGQASVAGHRVGHGGRGNGQRRRLRHHMDGGRGLLGGQTAGRRVIKSGQEGGLGSRNVFSIGQILVGNLGSLSGGETAGFCIGKGGLEGGLGRRNVLSVLNGKSGGRGQQDRQNLRSQAPN